MNRPRPRLGDREASEPAPTRPTPAYPVYELTVDAVRELDRRAVDGFGIPGLVLMENAARGLREHALDLISAARQPDTLVVCGPGNNGGDGLALARHLRNFGVPVTVVLLERPGKGDAGVNLGIVERMGVPVLPPDHVPEEVPGLVVDAVFGTGLSRPAEGAAADLIAAIGRLRDAGALVLAVDTPSGLDASTGEPLGGACVRADRTVTLAVVKPGLTRLEAQLFLGDLVVADIGAPVSLLEELGRPWKGYPGPRAGDGEGGEKGP